MRIVSPRPTIVSRAERPSDGDARWHTVLWLSALSAAKSLLRAPGFAALSVSALALTMGLALTLLSVASALVFRSLPVPDADKVVVLRSRVAGGSTGDLGISNLDWDDIRERTSVFSQSALIRPVELLMEHEGDVERVSAGEFSPGLLALLNSQVLLGQNFPEGSDWSSVILSYGYWQRRFGGDPRVLGETIRLNGTRTVLVIGVLPPDFQFFKLLFRVEPLLFVPVEHSYPSRDNRMWTGIGRLQPRIAISEARARLVNVSAQLKQQYPAANRTTDFTLVSLPHAVQGPWRSAILFLLGAVGLLLAVACGNVAVLFVIRTSLKMREFALRFALGAPRQQVALLLCLESVLVAFAGAGLGLMLALLARRVLPLVQAGGFEIPRLDEVGVDANVMSGAVLIALAVGVAAALMPMMNVRGARIQEAIAEYSPRAIGGGGNVLRFLILVQVCVVTVLIIGASTLISTFLAVSSRDLGYEYGGVMTMRLTLPHTTEKPQQTDFANEILERVRSVSGVLSASTSYPSPSQADPARPFEIAFGPFSGARETPDQKARLQRVSSDYFTSLQVPLLEGRFFQNGAGAFEDGAAIVNRSLVKLFSPSGAVGREIEMRRFFPGRRFRIVGVVEDTLESVSMAAPLPTIYLSTPLNWMYLLVRTVNRQVPPNDVRNIVKSVTRNVAVDQISSLEDSIGAPLAPVRLQLVLVTTFAAIALGLATVGIYSTLSLAVISRTKEFGVRLALGADPRQVAFFVMRSMLVVIAGGLVAGILIARLLNTLLSGLVHGLQPVGFTEMLVVCTSLLTTCAVASWIPLRRVMKLDPAVLLRAQ